MKNIIRQANNRISYPVPVRLRECPTTPQPSDPPPILEWVRTTSVVHPTRGLIPFEPYWYQQNYLAQSTAPRRIVLKSRQIGFSQVFALEALYKAIFQAPRTITIVSKSGDEAIRFLSYCYIAYNLLPDAPPLAIKNRKEMSFKNGSTIRAVPANQSTGRGIAGSDVYLDEFAFAHYAEEIYQSIVPTLSHGGCLVVNSTPDGQSGKFYDLWQRASGFERFLHPWYDCPSYNPDGAFEELPPAQRKAIGETGEWYQAMRKDFTAQQWAQEYECDFLVSGLAVFQSATIDLAPIGAIGDDAYQEGRHYLIAVDVGRRMDATVINVFDTTAPYQRVYHEYIAGGTLNYPMIAQRIDRAWDAYGGDLYIESNGVGDPLMEFLYSPSHPFVTSTRTKTQAVQALQLLLENGDIKAQWTEQERKELLGYQWDDAALQQDCVMSLAIAAYHLRSSGGGIVVL